MKQSSKTTNARSETRDPAVIALDLGGTKLASAIISPTGRILQRKVVLLEQRQGKAVGRLICDEIANLFSHARAKQIRITAIGLSLPGMVYSKTGNVWVPNIPGWRNYPLKREIQKALRSFPKSASLRNPHLTIASDRACYISGEAWRGNAKGCANAVFLAVGTGIGAGIMAHGSVLKGECGIAGAVGWMALDRSFQSAYKRCGCFEYHASGAALTKAAKKLQSLALPRFPAPLLQHSNTPPSSIFTTCHAGNPQARQVIDTAIGYWGMAVANLVSLFNPEKIIFGGGLFGPATKFIPAIYKEAKKWAQPIAIKQVKLQPAKLGADAGLFGAAFLALNRRA